MKGVEEDYNDFLEFWEDATAVINTPCPLNTVLVQFNFALLIHILTTLTYVRMSDTLYLLTLYSFTSDETHSQNFSYTRIMRVIEDTYTYIYIS